jgi:YD repeat-containing protein
VTIANPFGRTLSLTYNTAGQLTGVTTPDARSVGYSYDSIGRLSMVTYADGKTRTYLYESTAFPQAMTGIVDEAGVRFATFAYDAQGRAISTEHAGPANRYQVSYPSAASATVVDPLGTSRSYSYGTNIGKLAVTGGSLPSGTGESDAASRIQDDNGLIASETDFKGVKTDTTWDVARRLPISVTRAVGTPEVQTVTTHWHATFSLPVLVTESGRTTAYSYDDKGSASDFKGVATTYARDAQGNATSESSADIGSKSTQYDALGLPSSITDAMGQATKIQRDALGRPTLVTFADGKTTRRRVARAPM